MQLNRRQFILSAGTAAAGAAAAAACSGTQTEALAGPAESVPVPGTDTLASGHAAAGPLHFADDGHTDYGDWHVEVEVSPAAWQPGGELRVTAMLTLPDSFRAGLEGKTKKVDQLLMLVTTERSFDADGWRRLPGDERMSTLLTSTGLAIEGGSTGNAISPKVGNPHRTPVDELQARPVTALTKVDGGQQIEFKCTTRLPGDLPPGIYRLRLDFGAVANKRRYSLNGDGFAYRPPAREKSVDSVTYSPPIRAGGVRPSGQPVDGAAIRPRIPWVLLAQYNSNGYRGVVADEDAGRFALSERNIIPDEVILPLYNDRGNKLSYSLEPQFPMDAIDFRNNIPWDYASGAMNVQVTGPDGKTIDLGEAAFAEKRGFGPTTKRPAFTAWKPEAYGRYTVTATGWIADAWGNRYEGGGTYHFWIAKRMTMATATFQGQAYPVGSRYGRDIGFAPAVPADVEITATLYPDSDPAQARNVACSGRASGGGIFGAAQGMKPLMLDAPGEYHAQVLATYTDPEGHLWVCTMRHAGVVYPEDSPIVAHGKKLPVNSRKDLADRGDTYFEGYVEPGDDFRHLDHINFPYQAGDVLLIASEMQGANKIEPVMTYEVKGENKPYDKRMQPIGLTNIQIKTSNGYSPHMFPEYITDWEYYYAGAPRPGFMSRFLVGDNAVRAPYWPTSPNRFGGQINTSANGDQPGDIYRLLGGVVLRRQGQAPLYAGYIASAFILPKGTNNNRIIAPGAEDLIGSDGTRARLFLVGLRPGMAYEAGTSFAPAVQIDPILPAKVKFTLRFPDGQQKAWEGTGDKFGTFAGADRVALEQVGVYRYWLEADWSGYPGHMPGLPGDGGHMYVFDAQKPEVAAGDSPGRGAPSLKIELPNQSVFAPDGRLRIPGRSSAALVWYAAVIPGSVILQGTVPVTDGRFEFVFDPAAVAKRTITYDTTNMANGKPDLGRVVHLTFFSREVTPDGIPYHDFQRVIIRGNQVLVTR